MTLSQSFEMAIKQKDVGTACTLAGRFPPPLALYRALELTILFARVNDQRFELAARRFISRYVIEANPGLKQVGTVAVALSRMQFVGDMPWLWGGADLLLEELAFKLR